MTTTTGPTAARSPVFLALPEAPVPSEEDSDVYATKLGGRPLYRKSAVSEPTAIRRLLCEASAFCALLIAEQPGDLWNSAIDVVPVCVSKAEPDCAMEDAAKSTDEEDLDEASDMEEIVGDVSSRLSAVSLEASPSGSTDSPPGPSFPPYYLYLIEECAEPDYVKGYLSDLAQKDAVEMDVNEDAPGREGRKSRKDGDWADEGYEKASFPRGVDKTLRRFMDRLRRHPAQCVRYNAEAQGGSGLPLLYSHADPVGRRVAEGRTAGSVISVCPRCGSRRAFECQLMPNVISVLRASEHAAPDAGAPRAQRRLREGGGSAVEEAFDAIWNADDGMEFGTVLIYTCERDCHIASETADNEIGYFDEVALVQLEQN
ncbi:MAG: programmed cell death protein 2 [Olpidium bornovanus]|uniref:Programmed cell death protein 2 n=1 Tax=Olpidium bornovanus TaxID=278681 RepID=A0A8H7ZI06_9FUNG|nr:MAG: programmed cell death protein 2 [Olpidium bornovanus]